MICCENIVDVALLITKHTFFFDKEVVRLKKLRTHTESKREILKKMCLYYYLRGFPRLNQIFFVFQNTPTAYV